MNPETKSKTKKAIKRKKPDFLVRESKFSAGVKSRWRYPYGRHSATRQMHKGRPAMPHPGYGAAKSIFELHPSGYKEKLVSNIKDLMRMDHLSEGAVISSTVGVRKKLELIKEAKERKIKILNLKDVEAYLEIINKDMLGRKKIKEDKLKIKDKKFEEKKKKAELKEKKEKEKSAKSEKTGSADAETNEDAVDLKEEEKKLMEETITKRQ